MATDQEKSTVRNLITSGVQRATIGPDGTTTTEFRPLNELRGIRADLDAEDLVSTGRRATRTILIGTSKGIDE